MVKQNILRQFDINCTVQYNHHGSLTGSGVINWLHYSEISRLKSVVVVVAVHAVHVVIVLDVVLVVIVLVLDVVLVFILLLAVDDRRQYLVLQDREAVVAEEEVGSGVVPIVAMR